MKLLAKWMPQIDRWITGQSPRERMVLLWGLSVGALLVAIFGIWIPLQQAQQRIERSISTERKRLAVMESVKQELLTLENSATQVSAPPLQRSVIEEAAKAQLAPRTLELRVEGERNVKLTFSGVEASQLMIWIDSFSRAQRLNVDKAKLRREGAHLSGEIHFSGDEK